MNLFRLPATLFFFVIISLNLFAQDNSNSIFRYRINEDLGTLDWGNGEVPQLVVTQLMEGLTTSGKKGEAIPAVAESWKKTKSKTGVVYTFRLNKDAKWSDNSPICAQDFIDSWLRTIGPVGSAFSHYFFVIENATEYYLHKVKAEAVGLKAKGCSELQVKLVRDVDYFPALVSHWVFFPMKKGSGFTVDSLVVNGPYVLKEWKKNEYFLLERNPIYFSKNKKPYIKTLKAIVVGDDNAAQNLFDTGYLDWIKDPPFLLRKKLQTSKEFKSYPSLVSYYLGFKMPKTDDSKANALRCALSYSIDRNQIPKILNGNEIPAWGLVPEVLTGKKDESFYDLTKAKEFLKKSEHKSDSIEVNFYSKNIHTPLMEWLQQEWKNKLNLNVKIKKEESATYWHTLQQTPPFFFLSGSTAGYAHPYFFLSEFLTHSEANWGKWNSKTYDTLAKEIAASNDKVSNSKKIEHLNTLVVKDECAIVPLYFRNTLALVKEKFQKDFFINPMTYVYLKNLTVAE